MQTPLPLCQPKGTGFRKRRYGNIRIRVENVTDDDDVLGGRVENAAVAAQPQILSDNGEIICTDIASTKSYEVTCPRRRSQSSPPAFIFSPVDRISEIWAWRTLAIPSTTQSGLPAFGKETVEYIMKLFGDGFATCDPTPILHQGVVLMEIMKSFYQREVLYMTFNDLVATTSQHGCRHPLLGSRPLVIFLYQTTDDLDWKRLDQLSLELIVLIQDHHFRTYPCWSEFLWEARKLGDIQVLDDIARSPAEGQLHYRPKTCSGRGPCTLAEHWRTVQKRSNSCGSQKVKVIEGRTRSLACQSAGDLMTEKRPSAGRAVYFHQEFVDSFTSIGEFRVFLVCEDRKGALRGRAVKVVHTIRTLWDNAEDISAWNVTSTDCYWLVLNSSYRELHEFALYIAARLRSRHDWRENFESLEVGVRLDIGVAKNGSFFVNEITRWYGADFFSLTTLGAPYTQLCSAYATALHQYFS